MQSLQVGSAASVVNSLPRRCPLRYRKLCVRQVTLGVNAENKAAIALYERMSFKSFGREPCFVFVDGLAHDELQMACLLHAAPRAPVSHATVSLFDSKIKTRLAR